MLASIIRIGNSQGVRIPKILLEESGLGPYVDISVREGEIRILPAEPPVTEAGDTALLSEAALSDWNRVEEDRAWADL